MSDAFFSVPIQSIENMIDFVLVFWANSGIFTISVVGRQDMMRIKVVGQAHVFNKNANYDWLKRFDLGPVIR